MGTTAESRLGDVALGHRRSRVAVLKPFLAPACAHVGQLLWVLEAGTPASTHLVSASTPPPTVATVPWPPARDPSGLQPCGAVCTGTR